jgi:uncharacterized protein YaaR (DUF327 family)
MNAKNVGKKSQMLIMGKTSLINWLLGENVGIVKSGKSTSFISYLPQKEANKKGETLVEEMIPKGIVNDFFCSETKSLSQVNQDRKNFIEEYLEKEITEKDTMKKIDHINIYVKSQLLEYVEIVDSPGLGKEKEDYNDKKTLDIAEKASIVIYIVGEILENSDVLNI